MTGCRVKLGGGSGDIDIARALFDASADELAAERFLAFEVVEVGRDALCELFWPLSWEMWSGEVVGFCTNAPSMCFVGCKT